MPLYEMLVISRPAQGDFRSRTALAGVMRRAGEAVLGADAVLRRFEFLGLRGLPFRMRHAGGFVSEGAYWLAVFHAAPHRLHVVRDAVRFDPDVVRYTITRRGCSLEAYADL